MSGVSKAARRIAVSALSVALVSTAVVGVFVAPASASPRVPARPASRDTAPQLRVPKPTRTLRPRATNNYQSPITWGAPEGADTKLMPNNIEAVSCTSATFCMAVDSAGYALSFNGSSWSTPVLVDTNTSLSGFGYRALISISCVTSSFCLAGDQIGSSYEYSNGSWSSTSAPIAGSQDLVVSCLSTTQCVGIAGEDTATFDGTSWSSSSQVDTSGYLKSIACNATGTSYSCEALDGGGNALTDTGGNWSSPLSLSSTGFGLDSIACASTSYCIAVQGDQLFTYTGSWSAPATQSNTTDLKAVACVPGTQQCSWTNGRGGTASDSVGGAAPSGLLFPSSSWPGGAFPISCPTASFCLVGDYYGGYYTWTASSGWDTALQTVDQTATYEEPSAISCANRNFCMIVDNQGDATAIINGTPAPSQFIDPDGATNATPDQGLSFLSVSCPTSQFCIALDEYGNVYRYENGVWAFDINPYGNWYGPADSPKSGHWNSAAPYTAFGVSCGAVNLCVVMMGLGVSGSPEAFMYERGVWTDDKALPTQNVPNSDLTASNISCGSGSMCVATDWGGYGNVFNGTTWSNPIAGFNTYTGNNTLACPEAVWCMAGNSSMTEASLFDLSGATTVSFTSQATPVDGPSFVTCASPLFCAASDGGGNSGDDVSTWNGDGWSTETNIESNLSLPERIMGIACPDPGSCFVVDAVGRVLKGTGDILDGQAMSRFGQAGGGNESEACSRCQKGAPPAEVTMGDPVNTATGDVYETKTDLTGAGGSVPLTLTRTYSSALGQYQEQNDVAPGPLGYGWTCNLCMTVTTTSNGDAVVMNENGSLTTFAPYVSGSSPSWCISTYDFCPTSPRVIATLNYAGGAWVYSRDIKGETVFSFDGNGLLEGVSDATGATVARSTSTPGVDGCPSSATSCTTWTASSSGHWITLAFNPLGQLASAADDAGESVSYVFYTETVLTQECVAGVSQSTDNLSSVTEPDGKQSSFIYDPSDASGCLVNDLLSENLPGGGVVTNSYDTNANETWFGWVTSQTDPAGVATNFTYTGNNMSDGGGTTEVNAGSNGATYYYADGALIEVAVDVGPSLMSTTTYQRSRASGLAAKITDGKGNSTYNSFAYHVFDTTGNPLAAAQVTSSVDALGNVTEYASTASNEVYCVVDAVDYANGVSCPSQADAPTSPPPPGTDSGMTINVYNTEDELTSTTNALGDTSVYGYIASGSDEGLQYCSLSPDTYAAGTTSCPSYGSTEAGVTTQTFDSFGNVLTSTDADGNTTESAYTTFNKVWCTVDAADYLNGTRCPGTMPTSPPSAGTDLGMTINVYNAENEMTSSTDPLGNTTEYAYTGTTSGVPEGLVYCTLSPEAVDRSIACPSYGVTFPDAQTTTYDASGQVTSQTNAFGATTTTCYYVEDQSGQCAVSAPSGGDGGNASLVYSTTDPSGDVTSYTYNSAGQTLTQTVTFHSYSATTLYEYNVIDEQYCTISPSNYADGATCPAAMSLYQEVANVEIDAYDAAGRRIQDFGLRGVTLYAYDADGRQYCTVSPYFAASSVVCPVSPPASPPTPSSDPYAGAQITTYDAAGNVTQATSAAGGVTVYTYDASGNKIDKTVESNNTAADPNVVTHYSYDSANNLVQTTLAYGTSLAATTKTYYDPNGDVYCTMAPNAAASGSNYPGTCPAWQASWIAAPPSPSSLYPSLADNVTTSFANADGEVVQATNPDINTSITEYDPDGRVFCSVDPVNVANGVTCPVWSPSVAPPQGVVTGYTETLYSYGGLLSSVTDPLGDMTAYNYDSAGNKDFMQNPNGQRTTYCYYADSCAPTGSSGAGDMLYSTTLPATAADPSGEVTSQTYFPGGEISVQETPAGEIDLSYDAAGDLTAKTYVNTASGYAVPLNVIYSYNEDGARSSMEDWNQRDQTGAIIPYSTTTYSVPDITDSMTDTVTYSPNPLGGNSLSAETVVYTYSSTGVLLEIEYPPTSSVSQPSVTYAYNAAGEMTSVTDWAGNEVTFAYDLNGNVTAQDNGVSATNPNGTSSTAFTYDAANYMTQAVSQLNATTTAISPEIATRTKHRSGPGVPASSQGNPTWNAMEQFFNPTGTGSATANGAGPALGTSPTAAVRQSGSHGGRVGTGAKGDGQRTSTSQPAARGKKGAERKAQHGQPKRSRKPHTTCTPTTATMTQSFQPSPGYHRNADGQVTQDAETYQDNCGNVLYGQRNYSYDQAGQVVFQGLNPQGTSANNFAYDPAGCMTESSSHNGSGTFNTYSQTVDANCEVTAQTALPGSTGGGTYTYDTLGDRTQEVSGSTTLSFGYNQIGQMTSFTNGSSTTQYLYDGDGNEEAVIAPGASPAQFVWNTTGSLPLLLSDGVDYYIYGPNQTPVEQVDMTSTPPTSNPTFMTYASPDDAWIVTDLAGQATNFWRYDAYGNISNGSAGSAFGYAGQYEDVSSNSSGLTNMRARWYDSQTGSFTTVDPALASTDQPYAYAGNDPVNGSDPSGLNSQSSPMWSGCQGQTKDNCELAWRKSQIDIRDLLSSEFPGFNWVAELGSIVQGGVEGAATGAGISCLATGPACPAGAAYGGVTGFVGGVIGGAIQGVTDQPSYINAHYVYEVLKASLNTIYIDTFPYTWPYRQLCPAGTQFNCTESIFLQYTNVFESAQAAIRSQFGGAVVSQAAGLMFQVFGAYKNLRGLAQNLMYTNGQCISGQRFA